MDDWGVLLLKLKSTRFFDKSDLLHLPLNQYKFSKDFPSDLVDIIGYKELLKKLHVYCDSLLREYENYKNTILRN